MKATHPDQWHVILPATYCTEWKDGYGVRGWKLDISIGDPAVIASTEETGRQIPTSVFVHDIVDHHLCGLPMSGHRNEAIALKLLSERTASSPIPDYRQMTEEDILRGDVNGEEMVTFLPPHLLAQVPEEKKKDDRMIINYLVDKLGKEELKNSLIQHFQALGNEGYQQAKNAWMATDLDFERRKEIGLCLQGLLEQSSAFLKEIAPEEIHAEIRLSNERCGLWLKEVNKEYLCKVH
jgi:hypothetical protein